MLIQGLPHDRCDLGNEQNQVALFLQGLRAIGTKASDFKAFEQVLGEWYKVLGRLCQETGLPFSTQEMICSLVVAPLDVPHDLGVYHSSGPSPSYKKASLTNRGRPCLCRIHQAYSLPKFGRFFPDTTRSGAMLRHYYETGSQRRPRSAVKLYP